MNNLHDLFLQVKNTFTSAPCDAGQIISEYYAINRQIIQLEMLGDSLAKKICPALGHLRQQPSENVDLIIHAFDNRFKGLPDDFPSVVDAGNPVLNLRSADGTIFLQKTVEGALSIVDRHAGEAFFHVSDIECLPYWEVAAPLRIIINWWGIHRGMQLLHAAAVGYEGKGVLLAGKSGSGKSSTAVTCLTAGLEYAGDDHVLLDLENIDRVFAIFATAKLNDDMMRITHGFPGLNSLLPKNPGEKNMWFLPEHLMKKELPVDAILIPKIAGQKISTYQQIAPMKGLLALAPSTLLYCPGEAEQTLSALSGLARRVPTYEFLVGSDPEYLADTMKNLLRKL
jgi:hypothetical protein